MGWIFPKSGNLSYLAFGGLGGTCGPSKGVPNSSVQCSTPGACAGSRCTQGKPLVLRDSHRFFLFTYTRPFNSVLLASNLPSFLNKELVGRNLPRISFCCVPLIEQKNHFELQVQSPNPLWPHNSLKKICKAQPYINTRANEKETTWKVFLWKTSLIILHIYHYLHIYHLLKMWVSFLVLFFTLFK